MASITVDFEKCKSCELCANACPQKIIEIQKEQRNSKGYFTASCFIKEKCTGCAMCAMMCPECAIKVER